MSARALREELARGWSSPETYAAHLHLTADEGLAATATGALLAAAVVEGHVDAEAAGRLLAGLLERFLDELDDAGLIDEHRAVCSDIGSLWRVDWSEVGAAFLEEERNAA